MSVGYPDYSRTQSQAGNQLGSFFGQKGNDPATARIDCLGYTYLSLAVDDAGNVHNYTIVVTFYDDFGLTNIIGTRTVVPVPGTRFPYQVPIISRYAIVTCSHIVFGDTELIGAIVYGSNVDVPNIGDAQGGQPFATFNGSLGPGASNTINTRFIYEGPATMYASTSSGSAYFVQLWYYSLLTASFHVLYSLNGSVHGADLIARVSIPPCPIQFVVANSDTVARTLLASLVLG